MRKLEAYESGVSKVTEEYVKELDEKIAELSGLIVKVVNSILEVNPNVSPCGHLLNMLILSEQVCIKITESTQLTVKNHLLGLARATENMEAIKE